MNSIFGVFIVALLIVTTEASNMNGTTKSCGYTQRSTPTYLPKCLVHLNISTDHMRSTFDQMMMLFYSTMGRGFNSMSTLEGIEHIVGMTETNSVVRQLAHDICLDVVNIILCVIKESDALDCDFDIKPFLDPEIFTVAAQNQDLIDQANIDACSQVNRSFYLLNFKI